MVNMYWVRDESGNDFYVVAQCLDGPEGAKTLVEKTGQAVGSLVGEKIVTNIQHFAIGVLRYLTHLRK